MTRTPLSLTTKSKHWLRRKIISLKAIWLMDRFRLEKAGAELINIIKSSKENVYKNLAKLLNNPSTFYKTYWSIMKAFINSKKQAIIPQLLVNNKLISNFREKTNIFNDFFVQ